MLRALLFALLAMGIAIGAAAASRTDVVVWVLGAFASTAFVASCSEAYRALKARKSPETKDTTPEAVHDSGATLLPVERSPTMSPSFLRGGPEPDWSAGHAYRLMGERNASRIRIARAVLIPILFVTGQIIIALARETLMSGSLSSGPEDGFMVAILWIVALPGIPIGALALGYLTTSSILASPNGSDRGTVATVAGILIGVGFFACGLTLTIQGTLAIAN